MGHETQIREFVMSELCKFKNISVLKESDNLIETGILDSLGIMKLLIYLEEKFSIQIGDNDLLPENFETINKLLSLVKKKMNNTGEPDGLVSN